MKRQGPSANSMCNNMCNGIWQTGPIDKTHLHRRQSAGARRKYCLARNAFELKRLSVGVERQSALQAIGLPGEIRHESRIAGIGNQPAFLRFLKGRNFRYIDYVVELDVARSGDSGCAQATRGIATTAHRTSKVVRSRALAMRIGEFEIIAGLTCRPLHIGACVPQKASRIREPQPRRGSAGNVGL